MAVGYLEQSVEGIELQQDLNSSHIRKALQLIDNSNATNFVEFDFALTEIESLNNRKLIFAVFVILGGILSVGYVVISDLIRRDKKKLEEAQ